MQKRKNICSFSKNQLQPWCRSKAWQKLFQFLKKHKCQAPSLSEFAGFRINLQTTVRILQNLSKKSKASSLELERLFLRPNYCCILCKYVHIYVLSNIGFALKIKKTTLEFYHSTTLTKLQFSPLKNCCFLLLQRWFKVASTSLDVLVIL